MKLVKTEVMLRASSIERGKTIEAAIAVAKNPQQQSYAADSDESTQGKLITTVDQPKGLAVLITPFNFPLNLVLHKICPAIVAGCPWVLKPPLRTCRIALLLGELLATCGLPEKFLGNSHNLSAECFPLNSDPRIAVWSFTGSAHVGWKLRQDLPRATPC